MSDKVARHVRKRDVLKGIGLVIVMHFLPAFIPIIYFIIGAVQFVYIIPALIICRKNKGMVIGILIAAGLTLIINAIIFPSLMNQPPEELATLVPLL